LRARRLRDHVDELVDSWAAERPDLDTSPIGVVYRLTRVAASWTTEIDRLFAAEGITSSDFAVLANLRRAGAPFQLSQRQLMSALRLTSGTISQRIDKLAGRDFVERHPDPHDARATLVTLTAAGLAAFDDIGPRHLANEAQLVAALPADQRDVLGRILRTLLIEIEQPTEHRPDEALGFRATPAALAQRKRAELGLPAQAGLLVEHVRAEGPAATAGVRVGDLLVRAGNVSLCSLTCLERALVAARRTISVTIDRGGSTVRVGLATP
jgi:DNA-binding MarR family transcriptional regulator